MIDNINRLRHEHRGDEEGRGGPRGRRRRQPPVNITIVTSIGMLIITIRY